MSEISKAIEETGIHLDGITYWSISDTLDHNLERTNRKTYESGVFDRNKYSYRQNRNS